MLRHVCLLARGFAAFVVISLCSSCHASSAPRPVEAKCRAIVSEHVQGMHDLSDVQLDASVRLIRGAVHSMELDVAVACADFAQDLGRQQALGSAHLAEQVATHPACLLELETKSSAQTRCAQKWYKIGIHSLRVANLVDAADAMWHRAVSLTSPGSTRKHIGWASPQQTPTVWIDGLRSKAFWDCSTWPFVKELEDASLQILNEIQDISKHFVTAYPYLTRAGTWQTMFPFRGHVWNETLCAAMPSTCRLLLPELPTKPEVPFTTVFNEEVVIFRSEPGASVGAHCGSSNNVVNIHLTLSGASGTSLRVGGTDVPLRDRTAVCFEDSFFHSLEQSDDAASERISLVVRVMHPDMTRNSYGSAQRTDTIDLANWDVKEALALEVERLRTEHRKLSWATSGKVGRDGDL